MSESPAPEVSSKSPNGVDFNKRQHSRKQSTARFAVSIVLSILAGASLLLASVGIWVNNTVFNSSSFSSTIEKTLDEPEVNVALSRYLVNQLMNNLDVEQTISGLLPEEIEALTPVLTGAVRSVVQEVVQTVLADDRVQDVIGEQVKQSHKTLMVVLENTGPLGHAVSTDGNKVVLDLALVLERALQDVERAGVLLDRLDLPADFGKLVVYEGDAVESSSKILRATQDALSLFKRLLWVFVIAAPLLTVAAIYVASSRRHAVRRLGIVYAAVAAAVIWVLSQVGPAVGNMISNLEARPAAETVVDAFLSRLQGFGWLLFWLSLVVIFVATFYNQIVAQYRKYRNSTSD